MLPKACAKAKNTYACIPLPSIGFHFFQIPTFLRIVPSPLQGTSQRMRSKRSGDGRVLRPDDSESVVFSRGRKSVGKIDASTLVTTNAGLGSRAVWCMSNCVRLESLSLATNRPGGTHDSSRDWEECKDSRSWDVCTAQTTWEMGRDKMTIRSGPSIRVRRTYPERDGAVPRRGRVEGA